MPELRLVASQGKRCDGASWDGDMQSGSSIHLPNSNNDMPEVHPSQSRDTDQKTPVVDSIERQLRQMQSMAHQLFPDDETAANRHHVVLLEQRIRELGYRVLPLQVKQM